MAAMSFVFGFLARLRKDTCRPLSAHYFLRRHPVVFLFQCRTGQHEFATRAHSHHPEDLLPPRHHSPSPPSPSMPLNSLVAWLLFVLACLWFGHLPDGRSYSSRCSACNCWFFAPPLACGYPWFNVQFRDIANLVPFLLTIGFFFSPIGYTSIRIPEQWQLVLRTQPARRHHRRAALEPAQRHGRFPADAGNAVASHYSSGGCLRYGISSPSKLIWLIWPE